MRLHIRGEALRDVLWRLQCGLIVVSALLLGYWAFVTAEAWSFQQQQGHPFDDMQRPSAPPPVAAPSRRVAALAPPARPPEPVITVDPGRVLARLKIPRLRLASLVVEGVGLGDLRHAVGHIPGTALPGQAGNVAIAGHRDTFFRPLADVRLDDVIILVTVEGEFQYRVISTRIVRPGEVSVLEAGEGENLTLVTCYPFSFLGPAPDRFIVQAKRWPEPDGE